ncbi:MAG: hypothetical protein PHC65_05475 [Methanobacteriaceae archaeon]|nr:hypothetical protein [Methanobacteriaceae archaeon]MDD4594439.1 hypothetical protein [Methanobacteriaceae archaeon]
MDNLRNNSPTKNNYSIYNQDEDSKILVFHTKVGKSYKNHGWSLSRQEFLSFLPLISYEEECDAIIDGIPTKARLNIMPRIFYSKQSNVEEHLTRLHLEDFKDDIIIKLILNKEVNTQKIVKTDKKFLSFQKKIGKSYKNHGWTISRDEFKFLIPKTSYEEECDLIIDDIPTKGRLNILFRLFYKRNLAVDNHLKEIHFNNPSKLIDIVLLLNHKVNNKIILDNILKSSENKTTKTKTTEPNESINKNPKSFKINYIIPESNKITCIICGKTLKKNKFIKNTKGEYSTTCKKCYDKNVAAQYLIEILDYIKPNEVFNQKDLRKKCPNFNNNKILTLKEENIIITKLGTKELQLESENFIKGFLNTYGNDNLNNKPENSIETLNQNENIKLNLKLENDDLNKKISDLINLNDDLNITVSNLTIEKTELSDKIKKQDHEIKTLKGSTNKIEMYYNSLKSYNNQLNTKISKLSEMNHELKIEKNKLINKINRLNELNNSLQSKISNLTDLNNNSKNQKINNNKLNRQIQDLNKKQNILIAENNDLKSKINNFKKTKKNVNFLKQNNNRNLNPKIQREIRDLKDKENRLKLKIYRLNKNKNPGYISEINTLDNEIREINERINKLDSKKPKFNSVKVNPPSLKLSEIKRL